MIVDKDIAQRTADLLLSIKALEFKFDNPFTFTTGLRSPIYLDNRLVMSYPLVRDQIISFYVDLITKHIPQENRQWVSATATAAIVQGSIIADRLHTPLVFVRPTTKMHGKGNKMEGYIKTGSHAIIVEDHISTATSIANNAETIRELGGKVTHCIASTTYETPTSVETLEKLGIELIVLTTGKMILEHAAEKGVISQKEKESVDMWFADPASWANKVGLV
jgi:orotate phosphoribosyltransferase